MASLLFLKVYKLAVGRQMSVLFTFKATCSTRTIVNKVWLK